MLTTNILRYTSLGGGGAAEYLRDFSYYYSNDVTAKSPRISNKALIYNFDNANAYHTGSEASTVLRLLVRRVSNIIIHFRLLSEKS